MIRCPRCQRANPPQASFCHFDGSALRAPTDSTVIGSGRFLHEFHFPSGRRCRSFDELVEGCSYEWEDARALLQQGEFAHFLAGQGRADLARLAREQQAADDPDIALLHFIAALPAGHFRGPRLGLDPHRLVVGPLHVGESCLVEVRISNEGRGLLQGTLSISDGATWVSVLNGVNARTIAIKTAREQRVQVRVDGVALTVGRDYRARLRIISNGGVAEIPLQLNLRARPFALSPYQGATSPLELARRMRDNPHPAVALLETGAIARWFVSNGWHYPIDGEPVAGLAAVQQFFEELGLARPPTIQVEQRQQLFHCTPPEVLPGQVLLQATSRKPVHARAESDTPWLRVIRPSVSGKGQAVLPFEVDSALLQPGSQVGKLRLVANGGQVFSVQVTAVASSSAARSEADLALPSVRRRQTVVRCALLGLLARLLLVVPADLYARLAGGAGSEMESGSLLFWLQPPALDGGLLIGFVLVLWWPAPLLVIWWAWRQGWRVPELLAAGLVGGLLGFLSAALLACLMVFVDSLPRALLTGLLGQLSLNAWLATPLWIVTAVACWAGLGALAGLAVWTSGATAQRALDRLTAPLVRLLRRCGLASLASLLQPTP